MPALAQPDQLGAFMQEPIADGDPSAVLILAVASDMVRDVLQLQVDAVPGDVVLLEPIDGVFILLPELPVTAVTRVETFDGTTWTTADPATYTVSKRLGVITALPNTGVQWPTNPETWRVTYDHGFAEIPMSIVGAVLGAAAREWSAPNGIDSERIGGYQVKYSMEAAGFSALEMKALARYVNPRIA